MAGLEGVADFNVGQRVYITSSSASSPSSSSSSLLLYSSSVTSQAVLAHGRRTLGGWAAAFFRMEKQGSLGGTVKTHIVCLYSRKGSIVYRCGGGQISVPIFTYRCFDKLTRLQ